MDWYDIKFLESTANLKQLIKKSWGRTPSTKIANEIAVCIQQGRYFFEAASNAPLQIKPLLIYYGVLGFSKSIVLGTRIVSIDTLAQSHGLADVSEHNVGIERLTLRIKHAGTFQDFNDAIAPLARIFTYQDAMPTWSQKPFDSSPKLEGKVISLKEILSRIPELYQLYGRTFQERPNSWPLILHHQSVVDHVTLRIDDPDLFEGKEGLQALIQKWIQIFPFLKHWRFSEASLAWGYSVLIFDNVRQSEELTEDLLIQGNNGFSSREVLRTQGGDRVPYLEILPPLSGGIVRSHSSAIMPFDGGSFSEYSLQFLGSFLLSSLVRYRPQVWQHALSRSALEQKPADDRSLALVEQFFDVVLNSFPQLVSHCFDYMRTN